MDPNYPVHTESFEVVLLKKGVSSVAAATADFKRLPIVASSPLAAQIHDDVMKETDYVALFATKPGVMTEPEIHARRREMEGPPVDRTKM
jgi:hypothetical protein